MKLINFINKHKIQTLLANVCGLILLNLTFECSMFLELYFANTGTKYDTAVFLRALITMVLHVCSKVFSQTPVVLKEEKRKTLCRQKVRVGTCRIFFIPSEFVKIEIRLLLFSSYINFSISHVNFHLWYLAVFRFFAFTWTQWHPLARKKYGFRSKISR